MSSVKRANSLIRSLKALFGLNKNVNMHKLYPIAYYKHYYFPKNLCDGIDLIASVNNVSKRAAAIMLMERGYNSIMNELITAYVREDIAAREEHRRVGMVHFTRELKRYARDHGMDLSKII